VIALRPRKLVEVEDVRRAYEEASRWFVSLVRQITHELWERPGLGEWTVLELVGHTNRAHTTLAEYLAEPVTSVPSDYFAPDAIAARGRESVAALGDDPPSAVEKASSDAIALVYATPLDQEIVTPRGPMRMDEYLPIRVSELVIHGLDLARVARIASDPPRDSIETVFRFLGRLATSRGVADQVMLALAGREPLPPDFSLY
jgi:uncharacterized protein (TIGR03083 family)